MNYNRINYNFKFSMWCKSHLQNFKLFEKLQQIWEVFIPNIHKQHYLDIHTYISALKESQASFINNRNNVDFLTSIGNF